MVDINSLDKSVIVEIINNLVGVVYWMEKFFFSCGLAFLKVQNEYFRDLVETLLSIDPHKLKYTLPCRQTLARSILQNVHDEVEIEKKKLLKSTDNCLLVDGWKNKSSKMKLLVFTIRNLKVDQLFLTAFDMNMETEDGETLKVYINRAIKYAKDTYETDVCAITTDNDAKIKLGASLATNCKDELLLTATCNSHSGNLLIKSFIDDDFTAQIRDVVKAFTTPMMTTLITEYFKGTALKNFPETRFCYLRDTCESIHKNWEIISDMYTGIDDIELRDSVVKILDSDTFKTKVDDTIKNLTPICELINELQDPKKNLADATERWLTLQIPTDKYDADIKDRIRKAIHDTGYAAHLIHHKYKGQVLSEEQRTIAINYLQSKLDDVGKEELNDFLISRNDNDSMSTVDDPVTYWHLKSFAWPTLSKLCLKLLIIPASTALIEGLFSQWTYVHNNYRNSLHLRTSSLLIDLYHLMKHLKNGVWQSTSLKRKKTHLNLT